MQFFEGIKAVIVNYMDKKHGLYYKIQIWVVFLIQFVFFI